MFGKSQINHIRKTFSEQFASDACGYTYRKRQKGPKFRISEDERNNFIATFNKRIQYVHWSIFGSPFLIIFLHDWFNREGDSSAATLALWIGAGTILLLYLTIYYLLWNAPTRELQRRVPESIALNKREARELLFSKITYRQLVLGALTGIVVVWDQSSKSNVLQGWGVIWLLMGGGLVLIAAVQAFRKWRFSQQQSSE